MKSGSGKPQLSSTTTPRDLARLLRTSYSKLTYTLYAKGVDNLYTEFEIPKAAGGTRAIGAPDKMLKILQSRLKNLLEELYEPHSSAMAFIKGRGIVPNAKSHVRKAAVFNLDLEDFFHSIHFGRVRGLLAAPPYSLSNECAQFIAHLCCYKRQLPQGAPTSPVISNMISRRMDRELSYLASRNRAFYTRYADDITFSLLSLEPNSIYALEEGEVRPTEELTRVIQSNGFRINAGKTRMQRYDERQIVTGLKVNRKVNVDRRYIRKTRAMIHALEQDIDKAKNRNVSINGDDCASLEFVVAGRLNFIGMVKGKHDRVYTSLARRFNNLSLDLELPLETVVALGELDTQLHFYGASNRGRLERCVWVVCFEGVENLSDEQQLVQGTAFMLADERMLTCAHVFNKAGNPSYCFVHRIREPSVKYRADLKAACQYSDIAVLSIEGENLNCNDFLKIAKNLNTLPGYRLSVVGFPQLLPGHHSVSIKLCTVTNTFKKSTFLHCEVDTDIHSGSSGGPVLNAYMQVVGMAVTGITATFDSSSDQAVIEGTNAYISAEHFDTVPILQPAALLD